MLRRKPTRVVSLLVSGLTPSMRSVAGSANCRPDGPKRTAPINPSASGAAPIDSTGVAVISVLVASAPGGTVSV
ncbi:MAG: hypothetical protein K2Q07_06225 [Burkholderiaceae bacterium]|nr:hypothetical protein [Burkholderiaceae bacterium]